MTIRLFLHWLFFCAPSLVILACAPQKTEHADAPHNGIVATAHPLASKAGADILRQGGSAVDAAIAVQAVLGLVEPQSSGLAGGAFLLLFDSQSGRMIAFDGREVAPASATPDMFVQENGQARKFYDVVMSGKAVGVPGAVAMLAEAHTEFGHLDWAQNLATAHQLAAEGFPVSTRLHQSITRLPKLKQHATARAYFFDDAGAPLPVGHLLKNPAYAQTLAHLSESGPSIFYKGAIADNIIRVVNQHTGEETLTTQDMENYQPVRRVPVCMPYSGKILCSMGPPSSGGATVLQILGLLEQTTFASLPPGSWQSWHYILEASRLAYADRNVYLADPAYMTFGNIPASQLVEGLLSPAYLKSRAALISKQGSLQNIQAGDPSPFLPLIEEEHRPPAKDASPEPPSTTHFSIMDANGLVVSMTSSVEFVFGSHMLAGGMVLNNQLTDFSFLPTRDGEPIANAPRPGKRPRSSMSPVIILNEDGSFYGALGSPGGPAIIGFVAKSIIGHLNWGASLQDAIDLPNVVLPRGEIIVEAGRLPKETLDALGAVGGKVHQRPLTSGVYGFALVDGEIQPGADGRREGNVEILLAHE